MSATELCEGCGEELPAALITDGGVCVACADAFVNDTWEEG